MYSMYIIIYNTLIYYRIKGSHDDELEAEEDDDVILWFGEIIHRVSAFGVSRSDATGQA